MIRFVTHADFLAFSWGVKIGAVFLHRRDRIGIEQTWGKCFFPADLAGLKDLNACVYPRGKASNYKLLHDKRRTSHPKLASENQGPSQMGFSHALFFAGSGRSTPEERVSAGSSRV